MELEKIIENEEYFVHSYGDDEFTSFWNEYNDEVVEAYDFAVVLYDFITTQMTTFETKKNFIIGFSSAGDRKLTESIIEMCEEYYGASGDVSKRHYVRVFGRLDNAPLCPLNLEIRVDGASEAYNFTLDDYVELPPCANEDYVSKRDELYSGITLTDSLEGEKLYINDILYANERDRAIVMYEGANYMHTDQQISLALDGYTTGQIEKLIFKFSGYDADVPERIDSVVSTYIMCNNSSSEIYDGFYDTNCHTCPCIRKAYGSDMITKSFNLNADGTLTGYSAADSSTASGRIVLRSVTAIIDQKHWLNNTTESLKELDEYDLIPTNDLVADVNYVFLKEKDVAYDVYKLSTEELELFKSIYMTKNEEE